MKLLSFAPLLSLMGLLTFIGCSEKTAGTASETETSVSGILVDSGGNPAPGVAISVKPEVPNVALKEGVNSVSDIVSDNMGNYTFILKESGKYLLEGRQSKVGLAKRFQLGIEQDSLTLSTDTLKIYSNLSGYVLDQSGSGIEAKVQVLGTEFTANTSASGFFDFKEVAPYIYEINVQPVSTDLSSKTLKMMPVGDTVNIYLNPRNSQAPMVLDDFEDGDLLGALSELNFGSEWWKSATGGNVDYQVVANPKACEVCDFELNRVLRADIDVVDSLEFPFALFGLNLKKGLNFGQDSVYVDFSSMKSFSFYARGSGSLSVQFLSKTSLVETSNNFHFSFNVQLSQRWQQFYIIPQDIKDVEYGGKNFSWNDSKDNIWGISFVAVQDGSIWLDKIAIEGVDLDHFLLP